MREAKLLKGATTLIENEKVVKANKLIYTEMNRIRIEILSDFRRMIIIIYVWLALNTVGLSLQVQ